MDIHIIQLEPIVCKEERFFCIEGARGLFDPFRDFPFIDRIGDDNARKLTASCSQLVIDLLDPRHFRIYFSAMCLGFFFFFMAQCFVILRDFCEGQLLALTALVLAGPFFIPVDQHFIDIVDIRISDACRLGTGLQNLIQRKLHFFKPRIHDLPFLLRRIARKSESLKDPLVHMVFFVRFAQVFFHSSHVPKTSLSPAIDHCCDIFDICFLAFDTIGIAVGDHLRRRIEIVDPGYDLQHFRAAEHIAAGLFDRLEHFLDLLVSHGCLHALIQTDRTFRFFVTVELLF